jgi:hypothetical protein
MAHYAKVEDGIVTRVIVAEAEFFNNFVDTSPGVWLQTSYNIQGGVYYDPETYLPVDDQSIIIGNEGRQRKNYAGIGYSYDADLDAFIAPKPYESWSLNEDSCLWGAPIEKPNDENVYRWDEEAYQADNNNPKTAGWAEITNE